MFVILFLHHYDIMHHSTMQYSQTHDKNIKLPKPNYVAFNSIRVFIYTIFIFDVLG